MQKWWHYLDIINNLLLCTAIYGHLMRWTAISPHSLRKFPFPFLKSNYQLLHFLFLKAKVKVDCKNVSHRSMAEGRRLDLKATFPWGTDYGYPMKPFFNEIQNIGCKGSVHSNMNSSSKIDDICSYEQIVYHGKKSPWDFRYIFITLDLITVINFGSIISISITQCNLDLVTQLVCQNNHYGKKV